MKKILIAVSGGPDSMALLNKFKSKKRYIIMVAHVNYHFRAESDEDQKIVEKYCKKNKISYQILNITKEKLLEYQYLKNKQAIARKLRYEFFVDLAQKYQIDLLFVAHHRDDFIETAIIQEDKSNKLLFYGLKKESNYKNLKIKRPLLSFYKEEILEYCNKNNINFAVDKTNFLPIYQRNRIRLNLASKTRKEKQTYYKHYVKINKSNQGMYNKIQKYFNYWKLDNFSYFFFANKKEQEKFFLIYKFLSEGIHFININSNKIYAIINFLDKKPTEEKGYRLTNQLFLFVKDNKLLIKEK